MSVWPKRRPGSPSLAGAEGSLVMVSFPVAQRDLESLLETLAQVDFPINPEIHHDAALVYVYADGRRETETTTLVEFPAYEGRLEAVRRALRGHGFDPAEMQSVCMLRAILGESVAEPAPAGAPYCTRYRIKRRLTRTAC